MLRTKLYLLLLLLLVSAFAVSAQNPVKWSFSARDAGNCQVDLVFTGTIDDGWFTYSQFLESEDGPVATQITFSPGPGYKLVGKAKESGDIIKVHDKVFDMELTKFKHKAVLTQRITVADPSKPITGYLNFMVCNDEMCLPPKDVDFSFKIPALANCTNAAGGKTGAVPAQEPDATGAVLKHDTSITQIVTAPGVQ